MDKVCPLFSPRELPEASQLLLPPMNRSISAPRSCNRSARHLRNSHGRRAAAVNGALLERHSLQSEPRRRHRAVWSTLMLAALTAMCSSVLVAQTAAPSRKAEKGCVWEKVASAANGFSASVEKCDFGNRKIHLFMKGNALMQQYSDGGAPDTLIDIVDLNANETVEAGMQRAFAAHTKPAIAKRCVRAPYTEGKKIVDAKRDEFVPNAAFSKELARVKSTDIPDPPCGDWGSAPDGIQYFQVFADAHVRKVLFVRVGQDVPLFDERTLKLTVSTDANKAKLP